MAMMSVSVWPTGAAGGMVPNPLSAFGRNGESARRRDASRDVRLGGFDRLYPIALAVSPTPHMSTRLNG